MTANEFVALVGAQVMHVTAATNMVSIRARGLIRPVSLAALAGVDAKTLVLREDTVTLTLPGGTATLNHQRPLRAGRRADFLDGVTLEQWSAQLDARLFFWPGQVSKDFAASVAARGDMAVLTLDARALFAAFAGSMDIAAINTGSATRRPARRGAWIYAPVTGTVDGFRTARRTRRLVAGPDSVAEVSLRCDIPATVLQDTAVVTMSDPLCGRIRA